MAGSFSRLTVLQACIVEMARFNHAASIRARFVPGSSNLSNASSDDVNEALRVAVRYESYDALVVLLCDSRADVEAVDPCRKLTPLMYAAETGNVACVQRLLDHGADPNTGTETCQSALFRAARTSVAVTKLLLERGARVNDTSADIHSETPLMHAVANSVYARPEQLTVATLLDHGAHVNASDTSGRTALMLASRHGAVSTARALLDRGARVNAVDNRGNTVLRFAFFTSSTRRMLDLLMARGVSLDARSIETVQQGGSGYGMSAPWLRRVACRHCVERAYRLLLVTQRTSASSPFTTGVYALPLELWQVAI